MITISYVDLLFLVLTVCAIASTAALILGVVGARRTMAHLDTVLVQIEAGMPEADRVARETEQALRSVRQFADTAGGIARDMESVTSETRRAVLPLVQDLGEQAAAARIALRQLVAVAVGLKAGIAAFSKDRS